MHCGSGGDQSWLCTPGGAWSGQWVAGGWRRRWPKPWLCWGRCEPHSAAPQSPCRGLATLCFNNSLAEPPSPFSSLTDPTAITQQGPKARLKRLLPKVSTSFGKSKLRFQVLKQLLSLRVSVMSSHSVSSRRSQQCHHGSQPALGYNPTFAFTSSVALDES